MPPARAIRWEKTRKLGKTKYALLYGSLCWGGIVSLSWAFLTGFDMQKILGLVLPTNLVGGYVVGLFQWWSSEAAYARYLALNRRFEDEEPAHSDP